MDTEEKILGGVLGCLTIAVGVLVVALVFDGCHQASLDPFGEVESRTHRAAYMSSGVMAGKVYVPGQWHPETWGLVLDNGKRIGLSESKWETVRVGDYWGVR